MRKRMIIGFSLALMAIAMIAFAIPLQPGNNSSDVDPSDTNLSSFQDYFVDIDPIVLSQGVQHLNPVFHPYFYDPISIPDIIEDISGRLLDPAMSYTALSQYGFRLMGAPAGGIGPPLAGISSSIKKIHTEDELQHMFASLSAEKVISLDAENERIWVNLDFGGRKLIMEYVLLLAHCQGLFEQFTAPIVKEGRLPSASMKERLDYLTTPYLSKQVDDFNSIDLLEAADIRKLSYASRLLLQNIEMSVRAVSKIDLHPQFTSFTMNSIYGKIGIFGYGDDTIKGDYTVLVNLAGNDVYTGSFASTAINKSAIGILIDADGDDKYIAGPDDHIASGVMGAGILIDLRGDDFYVSENEGLASAIYGYSLIWDMSGNDSYSSASLFSQGAAIAGVAQLYDGGGKDSYNSKSYSQGFGGSKGVGMLVDFQGDDKYQDNISLSETGQAYVAFVQGAGRGRWAEASDGHSLGGGCGILIDGDGDDCYTASSFSQGAAYYFGMGFLYDRDGNDTYDAVSHSQGYAAHYGMACLVEGNGDDKYNARTDTAKITQIIGSGRDHSIGIMLEITGNDQYYFGNRSLGISDMDGIGICLDLKGDDRVHWHHNGINSSSPSNGKRLEANGSMINFRLFPVKTKSAGIFMDY